MEPINELMQNEIQLSSDHSESLQESNPIPINEIGTRTYDELFREISDDLISSWEGILLGERSEFVLLLKDDSEILNEDLNLPNQRVIRNDCDRTRVKDKIYLNSFRDYIECFLTYYCKKNNIKYKQGLNEIIAPFLLIKAKIKKTLSQIYNLFISFLDKFLTNYYYEDEFYSLQSSLSLLTLLLKYHEPAIYNIFHYALITPEMYATSWVLTVFANKCKLDVIYRLWNLLIIEKDQMLMHFIVVAFLRMHRDVLMGVDYSQVPSVISQWYIKDVEEVEQVVAIAKQMRERTPYSFRLLTDILEVFKPRSSKLKEIFEKYDPENILAMPMLPSEVFQITYSSIINCPNSNCSNFYSQAGERRNSYLFDTCGCCDRKIHNHKPYIFIDMRTNEDKSNEKHYDDKPGFLPMTVILDQDDLSKDDLGEILISRFQSEKSKYHIVLITSETDYFMEFEKKYYREKSYEIESKYELQTHIEKEINSNVLKKDKKSTALMRKLKEFDNIKKAIASMIQNEYQYVSYVYGGFLEIHEMSLRFNIPLLNHGEECEICAKNRNKAHKRSFFQKFFSKNEKPRIVKNNTFNHRVSETDNWVSVSHPHSKAFSEISGHTVQLEQSQNQSQTDNNILYPSKTLPNISCSNANILSIEEMASLISDPSYTVYTCLLLECSHHSGKLESTPLQIMIFFSNCEIKIYCMERTILDTKEETLSFKMIETIKIEEIKTISTRKQTKNIVTIKFLSQKYGISFLIVDLITDIDSKNFISKAKRIIESL